MCIVHDTRNLAFKYCRSTLYNIVLKQDQAGIVVAANV